MGVGRDIRTGFDAGIVDKEFSAREDVELYRRSLTRCDNFEISYAGSLRKRRGTTRLTEYDQSGQTDVGARLEVFAFDETQTWLVDLSPGTIVIRDPDGSTHQTLDVSGDGWLTSGRLWEICYTQLLDTAVLTHTDFLPKLLKRNGTVFSVEDWAFSDNGAYANPRVYQPMLKFPDVSAIYMQPGDRTGSTTMRTLEKSASLIPSRTITGITKGADTTFTTSVAHGLSVGMAILIDGVVDNGPGGDLEDFLNGNIFVTKSGTTGSTIVIEEDTSGLTNTYSSGGTADHTGYSSYDSYWDASHVGHQFTWRGKRFEVDAINNTYTAAITIIEPFPGDVQLQFGTGTEAQDFTVGDYVRGEVTGTTGTVSSIDTGNNYITVTIEQGWFKAPMEDPGTVDLNNSERVQNLSVAGIQHFIQWQVFDSFWYGTSVPSPTSLEWEEPAWSETRGFPGTAAFHSGRLWFAGTTQLPSYVFSSKAFDFFNFDVGIGSAADSIQYAIVSHGVHRILHMVSAQYLCLFTDSSEWWVPETEAQAITPGSFAPRKATNYGTKLTFHPFLLDGDPVFLQQKGQVLRRFQFDDQYTRSYQSPIISTWASGLIENPVQGFTHAGRADRGETHFWLVNGTGVVVQCTMFIDGRMAYNTLTHGRANALYLSGASTDSDVYFLVKDGTYNFIEQIVSEYKDTPLLDVVRTYTSGTPTQTFTVHDDYEATYVDVIGWDEDDDLPCWYLGNYLITSSTLTLPDEIWYKVSVGYLYESHADTVPINLVARDGTTRMEPKKLVSWAPYLVDTYSIHINGKEIGATTANDDVSAPPAPLNSDSYRRWELGYDTEKIMQISSLKPLACEIAAITYEVQY